MSLRPKGMSRKMPPGVDKSMSPKGGSVNNGTTRKVVARTPGTLGPRTA